ncbi:E3 ubiquitin-protein ligase MARCHF9-like isoform X1 [Salvia splendens]|uniref:E3 ubiquitin-protein ligase MARCHF9-like isoform X1 n=1 Tax=Salvia splendens TaxID=180675 RepID=UPI001C2569CF|nr:E3 ubiquitin-protein ligase MARCHF9-like isoform X1 [Salvia splendens]
MVWSVNFPTPTSRSSRTAGQYQDLAKKVVIDVVVVDCASISQSLPERDSNTHEECRVCQEENEEALISLGCLCRGGLSKAHHSCIVKWFNTQGSNKCEICHLVTGFGRLIQPLERKIIKGGVLSPLWVAFSILVGGLLLDVLISVTLGVSALPVNIIIGVIVVLGLGTALRLGLEFCQE